MRKLTVALACVGSTFCFSDACNMVGAMMVLCVHTSKYMRALTNGQRTHSAFEDGGQ